MGSGRGGPKISEMAGRCSHGDDPLSFDLRYIPGLPRERRDDHYYLDVEIGDHCIRENKYIRI